jgi:hypothetical protein
MARSEPTPTSCAKLASGSRLGIDADRENRKRDEADRKFFKGEQWSKDEKRTAGRITLRINRLPQFVKQVTGEMRQNKPAIRVLPKEEGNEEAGQGLFGDHPPHRKPVRRAPHLQQGGGAGGHRRHRLVSHPHRLSGRYELRPGNQIKPIRNPLSVVIDPDARELTRHDMNWAFVTELDVARRSSRRPIPTSRWSASTARTRICAVDSGRFHPRCRILVSREGHASWRCSRTARPISATISTSTINAERFSRACSRFSRPGARGESLQGLLVRMTGTAVIDKGEWKGKWIPLIPVIGEEVEAATRFTATA